MEDSIVEAEVEASRQGIHITDIAVVCFVNNDSLASDLLEALNVNPTLDQLAVTVWASWRGGHKKVTNASELAIKQLVQLERHVQEELEWFQKCFLLTGNFVIYELSNEWRRTGFIGAISLVCCSMKQPADSRLEDTLSKYFESSRDSCGRVMAGKRGSIKMVSFGTRACGNSGGVVTPYSHSEAEVHMGKWIMEQQWELGKRLGGCVAAEFQRELPPDMRFLSDIPAHRMHTTLNSRVAMHVDDTDVKASIITWVHSTNDVRPMGGGFALFDLGMAVDLYDTTVLYMNTNEWVHGSVAPNDIRAKRFGSAILNNKLDVARLTRHTNNGDTPTWRFTSSETGPTDLGGTRQLVRKWKADMQATWLGGTGRL